MTTAAIERRKKWPTWFDGGYGAGEIGTRIDAHFAAFWAEVIFVHDNKGLAFDDAICEVTKEWPEHAVPPLPGYKVEQLEGEIAERDRLWYPPSEEAEDAGAD